MKAQAYVLRIAILCLLALPAASAAHAQAGNYPEKPVTIISDAGAGASPDVATRIVADGLDKIWGQHAAVINHPGANGSIGARAASEAVADGYTLYAPALSTFVALPTVAPNLPIKLPRDFLPIGFIADQPMFLAVDPASGITTLPQLIERAKKDPGAISIAISGIGRMTHLTGVLLQQQAGIKFVSVPYTGGPGAALSDVAAGRVTMIIEGFPGHHRRGQCRAGQADRGGVAAAPAGIARSADGCRDRSGLYRGGLAHPGGAGRHAGADHRQSERGPDQGGQRSGRQEEARHYRQLCAPDDARGDPSLRRQAAGDLAAGAAKDLHAIDQSAVSGAATSKPRRAPRAMICSIRPDALAVSMHSLKKARHPARPFCTAIATRLMP